MIKATDKRTDIIFYPESEEDLKILIEYAKSNFPYNQVKMARKKRSTITCKNCHQRKTQSISGMCLECRAIISQEKQEG